MNPASSIFLVVALCASLIQGSSTDSADSESEIVLVSNIPENIPYISTTCPLFEDSIRYFSITPIYLDEISAESVTRLDEEYSVYLNRLLNQFITDECVDSSMDSCASLFSDLFDHFLLRRRSDLTSKKEEKNGEAYISALGWERPTLVHLSSTDNYDIFVRQTFLASSKIFEGQSSTKRKLLEVIFLEKQDFLQMLVEATAVPSIVVRQSAYNILIMLSDYYREHLNDEDVCIVNIDHSIISQGKPQSFGKFLLQVLDHLLIIHSNDEAIPYGLEYLLYALTVLYSSLSNIRYSSLVLVHILQLLSKSLKNNFFLMIDDSWSKAFIQIYDNIKKRNDEKLNRALSEVL